jgi:integrase
MRRKESNGKAALPPACFPVANSEGSRLMATKRDHVLESTAFVRRAGLQQANAPSFRFHDCRHTFASMLIAQAANIAYVSQQLGHASPAITFSIYTHLINKIEQAGAGRGRSWRTHSDRF